LPVIARAPAGAVLTVSKNLATEGRIGLLVDSERSFDRAAVGRLVTVTFDRAANAVAGWTQIEFDSWPIGVGIADRTARSLPVRPLGSRVSITKRAR